jgi:glycosyltransferase involved in cell wall biosynthesis
MDKKSPRVSVITVTYNHGRFLTEVIESVLSQTFEDWELIIVDDGSEDETPELVSDYLSDGRVRYIKQSHSGRAEARNHGITAARGKYLAILDADDRAMPERLEQQVKFLDSNPDHAAVGSWALFINDEGDQIGKRITPTPPELIRERILFTMPFVHSSVMMRQSVVEEIGQYNKRLPLSQDYDFMLRVVARYPTANIPEFLVEYRVGQWRIFSSRELRQKYYATLARWWAIRYYHYHRKRDLVNFLVATLLLPLPDSLRFSLSRWKNTLLLHS